ncbi:MAG: TerB family tellurite resistance protein [Acidobacteria bacterium]|nr:TerB family tellurite resistance protein [Acidobacteriota bacterium]
MKSLIWSWLGLDRPDAIETPATLRGLLEALARLEPERARYIARFSCLLGRVAHADQHVSPAETQVMETLVEAEGGIPREQAMLVVGLAKSSSLLFAGTEDFIIARDFGASATHQQKLALLRCLFAVSAAEANISIAEEREIHRIARELRVEQSEVVALRLEYRTQLPGLADRARE